MAINQTEVRLAVLPSIVLIPWTRPGKNRLIFVQHIRHKLSIFVLLSLAEDSHFATDDCFAKILAARLSEVRSISTLHMKTTRISRECPGGLLLKTWKHFWQEVFRSEDDSSIEIASKIYSYMKRKISFSPTFQIHCSHLMHKSSTISS